MNRPFELLSSTTIPLTADLAREHAEMLPSPTERQLMRKRMIDLQSKIDNDLAVPFSWAKAKMNGHTYRVNGQHTARLLADSAANGKFPEGLTVHMDEYKVEDEGSLAILFRQFDPRGSGRSPSDVAGAYQGLEEDLRSVPRPIAKMAIEGVAWFLKEIDGKAPRANDDRYEYFHEEEYHEFLQWVGTLFSLKTPELKRVQVFAAMWGTWEASEEEARIFWDSVARGGPAENEDAPASKLDAWLKTLKEKNVDGYVPKIKPPAIYQGCVYAWNAYRRGEKTLRTVKSDMSKGYLEISE